MHCCLHVVVDQEDQTWVVEIQTLLLDKVPSFSFSPWRQQPSLKEGIEFYATADITQQEFEILKHDLNNDWDIYEDEYSAYGFNTTMFHPHVYYLRMSI